MILGLLAGLAFAAVPSFTVDTSFPGGAANFESLSDSRVTFNVNPSEPKWEDLSKHKRLRGFVNFSGSYHFAFRVTGAAGKTLEFESLRGQPFGWRGPYVSTDGGWTFRPLAEPSYRYLCTNVFSYAFGAHDREVIFAGRPLYTERHLERFLAEVAGRERIERLKLCTTTHGRAAEYLRIGNPTAPYAAILTARHHPPEAEPSRVLEGIIAELVSDSEEAVWLRNHVEFFIIPFVAKDDVEEGGDHLRKQPHNYNRDYAEGCFAEIRAIRERTPRWLHGRKFVAQDFHTPGPGGHWAYVSSGESREVHLGKCGTYLNDLRELQRAAVGIPVERERDVFNWANERKPTLFQGWMRAQPGCLFSTCLEVPSACAIGFKAPDGNDRFDWWIRPYQIKDLPWVSVEERTLQVLGANAAKSLTRYFKSIAGSATSMNARASAVAVWEQKWPPLSASDRKLYDEIYAPQVVGIQPTFAHRDLCLCADGEIRHYGYKTVGGKKTRVYVSSRDWGLSWKTVIADPKDVGPMTRSPWSGAFVALGWEKYWGPYFGLKSAIGPGDVAPQRFSPTDSAFGKLGFFRLPTPMTTRRRWFTTGLDPMNATDGSLWAAFAWSDDDGESWKKVTVKPNVSTKGLRIGGDKEERWNNYCCEPTVLERKDGSLFMIARTSFNHPVSYVSKDGGETWTGPAEMPWMWMSNTIPTLFRLRDGRVLLFWNNTEPYPKPSRHEYPGRMTAGLLSGRFETVFTNRDVCHVALSEDEGETWIGFREIFLNPVRNREDFRELGYDPSNEHDKSAQQTQALELPGGKVLLAVGQGRDARRLLVFDPKWIYEKERTESFITGTGNVTSHLYVKSTFGNTGWGQGHCAWNRIAGPVMAFEPLETVEPIAAKGTYAKSRESLHMVRLDDPRLINSRQGVVWNFPAAHKGVLEIDCRIEGGEGFRLTLSDHWFNPSDEYAPTHSSVYTHPVTPDLLGAKKWKTLRCAWDCESGEVRLTDGDRVVGTGRLSRVPKFGVSYLHLQILSDREDRNGVYFREFRQRCPSK